MAFEPASPEAFGETLVLLQPIELHAFEIVARNDAPDSSFFSHGQVAETAI